MSKGKLIAVLVVALVVGFVLVRAMSSQVSTDVKLQILEAQREVDTLNTEFNNNKLQIDNWKKDWDSRMKVAQDKLNAAGDLAFKQAHQDKAKVNLDMKTWKFVKIEPVDPKQTAATPPANPPAKEQKK